MPGVTVRRISCNWECDEQQLSEEIHETLSFSGLKLKPLEKGVHLEMMLYARMMCIYPEMATKNIKKMNARGILSENNLVGLNCKGKMSKLLETLKERKDNGNKKIIFTTFRMETDYVKEELSKEGLHVGVIDGRVSKKMRNEILNKDLDVLLLQIKTGNEGLNLQQYNEVYFITPDWNPKMQEQAIARCHRMGQEKEVHVMKFVMDSFDNEGKTKSIEMHTEDIHEVKNEMAVKIYE